MLDLNNRVWKVLSCLNVIFRDISQLAVSGAQLKYKTKEERNPWKLGRIGISSSLPSDRGKKHAHEHTLYNGIVLINHSSNNWKIMYFLRMLFSVSSNRTKNPRLSLLFTEMPHFLQLWSSHWMHISDNLLRICYKFIASLWLAWGHPRRVCRHRKRKRAHIYINKISLIFMGPLGITFSCKSLHVWLCSSEWSISNLQHTEKFKIGIRISKCLCCSVCYAVLYIGKSE